MITYKAKRATQFVVNTRRVHHARAVDDAASVSEKSFVFKPETTLKEVFESLFHSDSTLPEGFLSEEFDAVTIVPDENSVPAKTDETS